MPVITDTIAPVIADAYLAADVTVCGLSPAEKIALAREEEARSRAIRALARF